MEVRRIPLLLAFAVTSVLGAQAQNEVMKQINEIKLRAAEDHLLTEQMMVDADDTTAVSQCTATLCNRLSGGYILNDIKAHVKTLSTSLGAKKLVFVYLDRDDLGSPAAPAASATSQPVKVKLRTEAEPSPKPVTPPSKPVVQEAPPKPVNTSTKATTALLSQQQPSFMREVMTQSSGDGVLGSLSAMKEQGLIAGYGSLSKVSDQNGLYIIILRRESPHPPVCVLSTVIDGQRLNLTSREVDSIENHRGEAAIWVKTK